MDDLEYEEVRTIDSEGADIDSDVTIGEKSTMRVKIWHIVSAVRWHDMHNNLLCRHSLLFL